MRSAIRAASTSWAARFATSSSGTPGTDLDLVREGPVEELAGELAERLEGRAVLHGRFGTAVVTYDGKHLDLIQARRETYPQPAALPVVEPGTIEDDLARRDFTINALAIPLPDGECARSVRRARRPRAEDDSRPARALVPRRSDADLQGDPVREAGLGSGWIPRPSGSRARRSRPGSCGG